VALESGKHRFLAPNNGILSAILSKEDAAHAVSVENRRYFLSPLSRTFHGRDIFAPVAAHLAGGVDMDMLGPPMGRSGLVSLSIPEPVVSGTRGISGVVATVDRFGNIITNIRNRDLRKAFGNFEPGELSVKICGRIVEGMSDTYESVAFGAPLVLMGSTGRLEISVNGGNAGRVFGAEHGETVQVEKIMAKECEK
jgi:S-adenosylmethionine hydrolase